MTIDTKDETSSKSKNVHFRSKDKEPYEDNKKASNKSGNEHERPAQATPETEIIQEDKGALASIQRFRQKCGDFVNSQVISIFIIILILVNSVMMGLATFPFVTESSTVYFAFEIIDLIFLVVFTIEIVLQLIFLGPSLFQDGWLVFDFAIVAFSWGFFDAPSRDPNAGGGGSVKIFRAFRIFRALRLVTRIESLRDLVTALLGVMPRMAAIAVLLLIIFYIFAVMFTDLFGDLYGKGLTEEDYFSRLDLSLFTQFGMMTLDWAGVAREIMNIEECKVGFEGCDCATEEANCEKTFTWAWIPIITFVMISSFIVFNLVIAVICDAVAVLHDEEEAEEAAENDVDPAMLRKKVRVLKNQVNELTNSQTQMLDSIEFLTRQFKMAELSKRSKKSSFE